MKYFSEKTNEKYDTEAELLQAEQKYDEQQKAEKAKTEAIVNEKKAAAKTVEKAEEDLKIAYANLDTAKEEIIRLTQKYNEDYDAIMNPAKKAVADAKKARYIAIAEFNKKYGAYTKRLTGKEALDEMKYTDNLFSDLMELFNPFRF